MPPTVAVLVQPENQRSMAICAAMTRGINYHGIQTTEIKEHFYQGPEHDVAVFYGMKGRLRQAFQDYKRAGKRAVYIDLGYWGRLHGGRRAGYHKVSVNNRHPTDYFQDRKHSRNRSHQLGIIPKPWRDAGEHILIAGMGAKSASFEGMLPEKWETDAVRELRKYTDRPIIYRPKPSWSAPLGIEGTTFSGKDQSLDGALQNCHAVVTHHSNVAVDALVAGVPSFCWHGVATPMSLQDLSKIEEPLFPEAREQWIADVAYCQWSVAEMAEGLTWQYLVEEGLVP